MLEVDAWRLGDPMVWALVPGDAVDRKELQKRYGGRTQGGIGPSRSSPNVLLFADPLAGEPNGYFDGWRQDGYFHYTGEGQHGDQQMKSGNVAIFKHASDGRALRLFLGTRGQVRYEGEFELAPDRPFYTTDAPETNDGPVRSVIVFRLKPVDAHPKRSTSKLDRVGIRPIEHVPVEEQWTEKAFLAPSRKNYEADRREQMLVMAFREHLVQQQHEVSRLKILPPGEAKPLFADLFDRTTNILYEAKGSVARGLIRMAIGQLLDYRRFVQPTPGLGVLVPSRPRDDVTDLLLGLGIDVVWKDGSDFVELRGAGS